MNVANSSEPELAPKGASAGVNGANADDTEQQKLYKVLEELAIDRKTIFHRRNGRHVIREDIFDIVIEAIRATEPKLQLWGSGDDTGRWFISVYIFGNYAVLDKEWVPRAGYD